MGCQELIIVLVSSRAGVLASYQERYEVHIHGDKKMTVIYGFCDNLEANPYEKKHI